MLVHVVAQCVPEHAEAVMVGSTRSIILSSKELNGPSFELARSIALSVESVRVFMKYPPLSYCNVSREGNW